MWKVGRVGLLLNPCGAVTLSWRTDFTAPAQLGPGASKGVLTALPLSTFEPVLSTSSGP
jgi:hypothetical protein